MSTTTNHPTTIDIDYDGPEHAFEDEVEDFAADMAADAAQDLADDVWSIVNHTGKALLRLCDKSMPDTLSLDMDDVWEVIMRMTASLHELGVEDED